MSDKMFHLQPKQQQPEQQRGNSSSWLYIAVEMELAVLLCRIHFLNVCFMQLVVITG